MYIYNILEEIGKESSELRKVEILRKYQDNEILKRVIYLTLSPRIKFHIKQIPEYTPLLNENHQKYTLKESIKMLSYIIERKVTGNEAINYLIDILQGLIIPDALTIETIIEKKLDIGLSTININKVFPKLIETTPYMGALPFKPELVKKMFNNGKQVRSDVKMDGEYVNAIIDENGEITIETRSGEKLDFYYIPKFIEELEKFPKGTVLNGELTIGGINRSKSNGIIRSLSVLGKKQREGINVDREIKNFIKEQPIHYTESFNRITYTVWDIITLQEYNNGLSNTINFQRLLTLKGLIKQNIFTNIKLINYKCVNSYEEAIAHFNESLNNGEEGTILKDLESSWRDGKFNTQIKLKLEFMCEMKIIGFNYGTGKNSEVISSFNVMSEDGLVDAKPTGLTEKMMEYVTKNQQELLGKIISVKCNGLTQDQEGNYGLLHPQFKGIRDDKLAADTLQEIVDIELMVKGLK